MKNYKIDMQRYTGNHPNGFNTYKRNDYDKFVADTGASFDEAYDAFHMDKGQQITINGRTFECIRHSPGRDNGFNAHEVIVLREVK